MTKLLLVPALLLAACTDKIQTDDQGPADDDVTADSPAVATTPEASIPTLAVGFTQEPASCDDHSVRLRGYVFTSDGLAVEDPICQFTLADGRTFDGCFVVPSLPEGQLVTFTATDPVTGATASFSEGVSGPLSFDVTLDLVAHDHAFSWVATTHYGAGENVGDVRLDVDPLSTVVVPDEYTLRNSTGTVRVTALGTYTVTANAVINFGGVGSCGATATKTVTVFCDGSAHGAN